jgi:hypothetical protein
MSVLALAAGVIVLTASAVLAGQFAEFEEQLRATDAPYRNARFQTNKKDKAASERKKFSSDWTALAARWGKEPPRITQQHRSSRDDRKADCSCPLPVRRGWGI